MKHEELINAVLDSLLEKAKSNKLQWQIEPKFSNAYLVSIKLDECKYHSTISVRALNNTYLCMIALNINSSFPSVLEVKETATSCETKNHQIEKLYRHASQYVQSKQDEHDEKLLKSLLEKLNS